MWTVLNKVPILMWWFVLIRSENAAIAILTANTTAAATVSVSTESSFFESLHLISTPVLLREDTGVSSSILESPSQKKWSTPVLISVIQSSNLATEASQQAGSSRTKKEMSQKKSIPESSPTVLSSFHQVLTSTESHESHSSMFLVLSETNSSEIMHFIEDEDLHSTEHPHLSVIPLDVIRRPSSSLYTRPPNISVSTAISTSTSTRVFVRSSNRKHERKQAGFQDIITGLVKLLGGKNVRVANGNVPLLDNVTDSTGDLDLAGSRINHRAPPKVTFAEPDIKLPLSIQSTTTSLYTSTTNTSDIRTFSTPQPGILPTSTQQTLRTTAIDNPTLLEDNIATLLESSLSSSIDDKQQSTTLDEKAATKTEELPTGPITEWLPVRGAAIGFRPKETSTTTTSTTRSSFLSTTSTLVSVPKEAISTTSREKNEAIQLPTEISYAGYVPSKPSRVEITATKSSDESLPGQTEPTLLVLEEQREPHEPLPGTGTVFPIAKPDDVSSEDASGGRPTETRDISLVPTRSPTGSPFVIPVDIQKIRLGGEEGELSGPHGVDQSVFIDGRKTYFNLMPTETATGGDSTLVNVGIGYTFPDVADSQPPAKPHQSQGSVTNVRLGPQQSKPVNRPEIQPVNKTPIRIDTCIIGDESACNVQWNETCRVEGGVSSCNCRLGYGRDGLEQGCKPVVSLTVYIKVDRVNHEQISFGPEYQHAESEKYQILEYEAKNAVDSAFSLSALAETFVGSNINSFFSVGGRVIINATVNLLESPQTRSPTIKQEIRRSLISVIQQQKQNIGQSRLYVNGPLNPIPGVQDLNECSDSNLNDCSKNAVCTNAFGYFKCVCHEGFLDKYGDDQRRSGRICTVCSPQYCNNRGECLVSNGVKECKCHGQYIGSQCETDGEVLGVALGASLAALLIIVLTLVCLCMWSRRWKRDQQKMLGRCQGGTLSNSYSYFNKPSAQTADFHLPSDDRIRWPRSSDQFDNFYAQPEPASISGANNPRGYTSTRPPSQPPPPPPAVVAVTSNSTAHRAVQHLRSLPTTLTSSRSNILDDTDEVDVDDVNTNAQRFYFPRPKSRIANVTNHGNVYYDVTFPNSRDQYTCNYDKDYGNITDVFPMKTINRPYHS